MEFISWNHTKNEWLKKERGICFEEIVLLIESDDILGLIEHPNQKVYPNQMVFIVNVEGYAYLVPFVQNDDGIFLKTIIPSRKYTKKYLAGE
jgi:hypothetical protein